MEKLWSNLLLILIVGCLVVFALFSLDIIVVACPEGHISSRMIYSVVTDPDCTNSGVAVE